MSDILTKIIVTKHNEVIQAQQHTSLFSLQLAIKQQMPCRDFAQAIIQRVTKQQPAVIAEIKKASPSKGLLREPFYPAEIATSYELGGAACLSVLTDVQYFQGSAEYLKQARSACTLPVLRKDFIIDEYQIYEARAMGADAILLIAACLTVPQMRVFEDLAHALGMTVLVEVHNAQELKAALQLQTPLLGINNRNLKNFDVSLQTTLDLLASIPSDKCVITESGIHTATDIMLMRSQNVHAFLIGEVLMRQPDPGAALHAMFR